MSGLREAFDEVYLDLPPALPFADAGILAHQADGVVMVIRAHHTPTIQVRQALEALAGAPVVGCVLNGAEGGVAVYRRNETRSA